MHKMGQSGHNSNPADPCGGALLDKGYSTSELLHQATSKLGRPKRPESKSGPDVTPGQLLHRGGARVSRAYGGELHAIHPIYQLHTIPNVDHRIQ